MQKKECHTDCDDLHCLREAKDAEKDAPTIGIEELKKRISKQNKRSDSQTKKSK